MMIIHAPWTGRPITTLPSSVRYLATPIRIPQKVSQKETQLLPRLASSTRSDFLSPSSPLSQFTHPSMPRARFVLDDDAGWNVPMARPVLKRDDGWSRRRNEWRGGRESVLEAGG